MVCGSLVIQRQCYWRANVVRQKQRADSPEQTASSLPPEHWPWCRLGLVQLVIWTTERPVLFAQQCCGPGSFRPGSVGEPGVAKALSLQVWVATEALARFRPGDSPVGEPGAQVLK